MSGKMKSKPKRVVETSLGKAPKTEKLDIAHLKKPIETSISGIRQAFNLFQGATSEVKDYISFECDILYECRICRTIFRSLANFIHHKRDFCREKVRFGGGNNEGGYVITDEIKTSSDESRCATPVETSKRPLDSVVDKLMKKQQIEQSAEKTLSEDLSNQNEDDDVIFVSEQSNVVLQTIDASKAAVFQTRVGEKDDVTLMKSEVMEIHGILDNQAILGNNGKIYFPRAKQNLSCKECNIKFSTEKTLTHHIKYKHNKTCIVYICPDCKETFSNAWSVYRHLYKVHRRTTSQVRRMRYLVHSNRIRKDQQEPEPAKKRKAISDVEDNEENQWMNNVESDKDFQMCGGCGKRFERKAALQSHSQMCTKRIALCNSFKTVKIPPKDDKKTDVKKIKGAAKRKQTSPVIVKAKDGDVMTITKDGDADDVPTVTSVPEFEILTISDESDNEVTEDSGDLKSKRHLWSFDPLTVDISDEYKEYVNDEDDHCFLAKSLNYIEKNELKCVPCQTTFMSLYLLLRHMSLHFSWYRFQCSKCDFVSFHKYDCTTHAQSAHSTPNTLIISTVLPIAKWKVFSASHDFVAIEAPMPDLNEETFAETIEVDDEMPDLTEESGTNCEKKDTKAGPSMMINDRPVRNRTRSVKTLQNDFIYDLAVNITDGRNKKIKKGYKCFS